MIVARKLSFLIFAAFGASAAAMAAAQGDSQGLTEKHRIVIMEHAESGTPVVAAREFRLQRGADGKIALPEGCENGSASAEIDERDGPNGTRILICAKAGVSPAERLEVLERAKERLASNEHLSEAIRDKVQSQLESHIARLRAQ
jgi:hypothetical protein